MTALIQSIALDVAGLGLLGAGAYCLITGRGGAAAPSTLFGLGGTYIGVKVATLPAPPASVKDTPPAPAGVAPVPAQ